MSERIEGIRERLGKATPGPWRIDENDPTSFDSIVSTANDEPWGWVEVARSLGPDSDLIANAPADVAFLLAEVERLERAKAKAQARAWDKGYGKGREDGESWHVRTSGRLPHKQSPNPYRTAQ